MSLPKTSSSRKSLKLAVTTANFRRHECSIVASFYADLVFTVTSKQAHRDSCFTPSACCASSADEEAAEAENGRPLAVGDAFAGLVGVALSAGRRQAGNSNRMASKRVSIVLALEEQSREVGSTLRQPGNT